MKGRQTEKGIASLAQILSPESQSDGARNTHTQTHTDTKYTQTIWNLSGRDRGTRAGWMAVQLH